jgi:hypothetical protein
VLLFNCVVVLYTSNGATPIQPGGAGTNLNNTFYNYQGAGYNPVGTFSNTINGNPGYTSPLITVASESAETIITRSAALLVTSTNCLDNADPGTATSSDILGISRPQGSVADRGAYEYEYPVLCWNYRARYKDSNRMYAVRGAGKFPRDLRVPSNVDISSGCMMDKGQLINPDQFRIVR